MKKTIFLEWKEWRDKKTEAFQYLIDYLFERWNLNEENNYFEFRPKDVIFRHYFVGKGIDGIREDKEVYSLSLNSFLWFDGRIYPKNFQFFEEEEDLFIKNCTVKLFDIGKYSIFQDVILCDDVFCRYENLFIKSKN
jgi:hypothetical protein